MNQSWRTSAAGYLSIAVGILNFLLQFLNGSAMSVESFGITGTALTTGIGLLAAKDAKVTGLPGRL